MDIYSESTTTPFTYYIGWTKHNKYYYGVRYAKGCSPEDLWTVYFTSSDYVTRFREEHGEPDVIKVHKTFKDPQEAIDYESYILERFECVESDNWMNMHNQLNFNTKKLWENPEYRKKMSKVSIENNKKIWSDPNHIEKMSKNAKKRWQDPEYRKKMSEAISERNKKRWQDPEYRKKMTKIGSDQLKKIKNDPAHKEMMSKTSRELLIKQWQDPEYREKITNVLKQNINNLWADPISRERLINSQKESRKKRSHDQKVRGQNDHESA